MADLMNRIDVTIKTINNTVFNLQVSKNISIHDLKSKIKDSTEITEERQRLIYRGQVLSDQSSLTDYKIEDGHIIHLVSRPANFRELQQSYSEDTTLRDEGGRQSRSPSLQNQSPLPNQSVQSSLNSFMGFSALLDPTSSMSPTATTGPSESPNIHSASTSLCPLEPIRQSLLTMHTLISTMEKIEINPASPSATNPFMKSRNEESFSQLGVPFSVSSPRIRKVCKSKLSQMIEDDVKQSKASSRVGNDGISADTKYPWTDIERETDEKDRKSVSTQVCKTDGSSCGDDDGISVRNRHSFDSGDEDYMEENQIKSTSKGNSKGSSISNLCTTHHPSDPIDTHIDAKISNNNTNESLSKSFFVGQWLDVKDTVSQWLEATVLRIDEQGLIPKIFIHYNGWPSRWDEWLNVDSSRIAPFRTRTTHSPHTPHHCPAPTVPVPFAPRTGRDDVRVLLPEIHAMMCRLAPAIEEAAALAKQSISQRPTQYEHQNSQGVHDLTPTIARNSLWTSPLHESSLQFESQPDHQRGSSQTPVENPRFRLLAAELCPLIDRFGRILSDLSPHLRELATDSDVVEEGVTDEESKYDHNSRMMSSPSSHPVLGSRRSSSSRFSSSNHGNMSRSSGRHSQHPQPRSTEAALLALLRNRTPSPPPERMFRQPVLVGPNPRMNQADGGHGGHANHLDIHIHAILTPISIERPPRFGSSETPLSSALASLNNVDTSSNDNEHQASSPDSHITQPPSFSSEALDRLRSHSSDSEDSLTLANSNQNSETLDEVEGDVSTPLLAHRSSFEDSPSMIPRRRRANECVDGRPLRSGGVEMRNNRFDSPLRRSTSENRLRSRSLDSSEKAKRTSPHCAPLSLSPSLLHTTLRSPRIWGDDSSESNECWSDDGVGTTTMRMNDDAFVGYAVNRTMARQAWTDGLEQSAISSNQQI